MATLDGERAGAGCVGVGRGSGSGTSCAWLLSGPSDEDAGKGKRRAWMWTREASGEAAWGGCASSSLMSYFQVSPASDTR